MDRVALVAWIVAALALLAVEATTLAFVAVYFGAGALAAALAAALGATLALQMLVFALVSVVSLVSTRKLLTRALRRSPLHAGDPDSIVGRRAVVTIPIAADGGRGQIRVGGDSWSARAYVESSPEIEAGTPVEVLALDGLTALVVPLDRALTE